MADYNYDIQKLYLEMFLADAETFVRCQNIFDPANFDRKLQPVAENLKDYVDKYKVMPELRIISAETGMELNDCSDIPKENYEWLLDEFERFSRHKALERAILESADLLEKGEYGPVEAKIKAAVQISLAKDMGTDYFYDPRARLLALKDNNGQLSTGWKAVDQKLYGGFNRGELNIFCGGSGAGKSLFLQNLAVNFATVNLNVLYVTLELSEALTSMRIDSMITGITTREIFKSIDEVELKVKVAGKKSGAIQVKYMPSGKTVNDLRAYVKEYSIRKGLVPDVILIDYLDLLMPISIKISPENLFIKDKYVSEELRNFAMEIGAITVTASQLNRAAVEEVEFDHSHISGGLSKIQTADNVIGIFTSRAMRERGRYQIQFMKTRSSSGVGQKVDLAFDPDTLRITDCEDGDDEYNPNGGRNRIAESIKSRTTVSRTSEEADPIKEMGRVRAETGSSKLRELLGNLGSGDEDL
jgi:KaiC/GvpD/RAD55 family RecA-like ATPase